MFLKKHEQIYKNNTINADAYDKRRFNELLKMSKGMNEIRETGEKEYPLFSQLMGDIWSSLYKTKPTLLPDEDISKELIPNQSYMQRVLEDESFATNREITKLDDLSSALSTISFSNKVKEWILERKKQDQEFNHAVNEAMEELLNKKQREKNGKQPTKKQQQSINKKMSALAEQLNKQFEQSPSNQIEEMMKQSVQEAKGDKDHMKQLISGLSAGNGDVEMEKIPLREKFALAEALKKSKKMKGISEWAGKFKQIAKSKQKSLYKESIERSGVTLGNEIDRLLPSELANMVIPQSKLDFMRRFTEGQTMQYDKNGKETLGLGPIILCLDESSSMTKLEEQSKGFALALMSIAKKQKRDFALISFSNKAIVREFRKGISNIKDLVDIAETFMRGGTNFYAPLRESLNLINKSSFKNADIVFVTDGEANLPNEFIQEFNDIKKKKEFECLTILLGNDTSERNVRPFSDKIIKGIDFTEADQAFEI